MNPPVVIPAVDALPLPAPVWVFKSLLHLTFLLHLLFMNFMLGGAIIAAVSRWRGRRLAEPPHLARWIERKLPPAVAFTVTLGVAPLLFVQALYGHLFYTSSVIMAWPWWLVVPTLTVCYYLAYLLSFKGDRAGAGLRIAGWVMMLGFVGIAFVYVNNMTLALRPQAWAQLYFKNPGGMHGNLGDPQLYPRFLHMLLAAIAVMGLVIAYVGARRISRGIENGRVMFRAGAHWFLVPTTLQLFVGTWFLLALPRDVLKHLMGGGPMGMAFLTLAILFAVALLATVGMSLKNEKPYGAMKAAWILLLLILTDMVLLRDLVRDAMLKPHFELAQVAVRPQWAVFLLFVVLFVIGLGTLAWMLKVFFAAKEAPAARAEG